MSEPLPSFGIQYLHGSHSGPEAPTHCKSCGRPMVVYETQGYWRELKPKFRQNGSPNMIRHARCSAPWLIRLIGLHDHAVQDDHGDWPWV